jgi:hypothetical protein
MYEGAVYSFGLIPGLNDVNFHEKIRHILQTRGSEE